YDGIGNIAEKIIYSTRFAGGLPMLSTEEDRHYRYFYNQDGTKRAEQLPSGQVIVYTRNKAGELIAQTKYVTPIQPMHTFNFGKIKLSKLDETELFILDAKGQCIEHRDAAFIKTRREYDAGGRLRKKERATHQTSYGYDALDRVISESN